jgi:hypothetical protein
MGILVKDSQKKGPTSSSRSSLSDKCKWEKWKFCLTWGKKLILHLA